LLDVLVKFLSYYKNSIRDKKLRTCMEQNYLATSPTEM